jgi:peptidoglycan-associated lipoprotein
MTASSSFIRRLLVATTLLTFVLGAGCASKQTKKEDEGSVPNAAAADENHLGDSDSNSAMGLQTVHYPYDSSTLDSDGKAALKANAAILKGHSSMKIQIEGHCDQRGGIQYNLALGEKRANSAKAFLQDEGIAAERITTISFGKEKPVDTAETEAAYGKNRRANFVITTK